MKTKSLKEITADWLERHYFDGMYNTDPIIACACKISDLFPCGQPSEYACRAGVFVDLEDDDAPEIEFKIGAPREDWIAERISKSFAGSCGDLDPET